LVVTVTAPELYRLLDPTPVVPIHNSNCFASLPGVHTKVALVLDSGVDVFGVGVVSTAGVVVPEDMYV
jgi:hypothetical protein